MELKICNISKTYGEKQVLDHISMSLTPGIYGLLGPNGAGKSTLMNILVGNLMQTDGEILFDGSPISDMGQKYRELLGYMPQQQIFYPFFTAQRFLEYMAVLKGMESDQAEKQIQKLLTRVELTEQAEQKIKTFSGGMKQRLLLAQALLGNPKIIVLDEPSAGLDPKQRILVRRLILEAASDKIILIATHVISDVESIAKEMILLKKGRIIRKDTGKRLIQELQMTHSQNNITLEDVYMYYFGEKAGRENE